MRSRLRTPALIALLATAVFTIGGLVEIVRAQTTTALAGSVNVKIALNQAAAGDLGTTRFQLEKAFDNSFTFGAGANQINRLYAKTSTVSASSSTDLDLAGVLTDMAGQTITFARVKVIAIKASAGNTNNCVVKPDASAGFLGPFGAVAHQISLPPGASLTLVAPTAAGWVVTATTADLLEIGNSSSGSSVACDVIIAGSAT